MNIAVYEIAINQFSLSLEALKGVLNKGREFAAAKKIDFTVLAQTRLIPDQFPLVRQVQLASDTAKACAARLTGTEAPKMEDKETTFDELIARIDATIDFLKTVKAEQFNGYEARAQRFAWRKDVHLEGRDYFVQHAIPNFYFHVTTAYSILRASGVDVGKNDFLGAQHWKQG